MTSDLVFLAPCVLSIESSRTPTLLLSRLSIPPIHHLIASFIILLLLKMCSILLLFLLELVFFFPTAFTFTFLLQKPNSLLVRLRLFSSPPSDLNFVPYLNFHPQSLRKHTSNTITGTIERLLQSRYFVWLYCIS